MQREIVGIMRETGWSPIYCRRLSLRRAVPSKPLWALLLHKEICDDNLANNGGVFINFWFYEKTYHNGLRYVGIYLRTRK